MLAAPAADDPQVIIVEPCYESAPHFGTQQANDNHAPLAVGHGEDFLRQVYLAVTANAERWASTVMILCFDEHGGFYDHVPPPRIGYTTTGDEAVTFSNLGPRIPGIVISPFAAAGSVFSGLLDHTSILQFLAEKFGNGALFSPTVEQRREQQIGSISAVLSEQPARPIPPVPTLTMTVTTVLGKQLAAKPPEAMEQAFANAADQMMAQYPAQADATYPELKAWKDGQARK
jgi:phospholipase C